MRLDPQRGITQMALTDTPLNGGHIVALAQGNAGAAQQVTHIVFEHVLGQPGPQHGNYRATTMGGMNTGAANLCYPAIQMTQHGQIKLAAGIETAGAVQALTGQHPGVTHDLTAVVVAYHQMQTVFIKAIAVQSERRAEAGTIFLGENTVAQTLDLDDFPSGAGEVGTEAPGIFRIRRHVPGETENIGSGRKRLGQGPS